MTSERGRLARSAGLFFVSKTGAQALSFVRGVVLARLLTLEANGIGIAMGFTITFVRMLSEFSADKLLVQDKDGNDPAMQSTLHTFQACRGVVTAMLVFLFAGPIASCFGAPDAAWAFRLLAVAPLVRGFSHLDLVRVQRSMDFGPAKRADVFGQAVSLFVACGVAWQTGSYAAVACAHISLAAVHAVVSFGCAHRRYALGWESRYVCTAWRFGLPLMCNGLLLFAVSHTGSVLVGSVYSMESLAYYGVAVVLVSAAADLLGSVLSTASLPALAATKSDPGLFARRYRQAAAVAAAMGVLLAAPMAVAGGSVVGLVYGSAYKGLGTITGLLAFALGLRLVRMAPTLAALSLGDSKTSLWSTAWKSLYLPLLLLAVWFQSPLEWVAACPCAGESIAIIATVLRCRSQHGLSAWVSVRAVCYFVVVTAAGWVLSLSVPADALWLRLGLGVLVSVGGTAVGAAVFPELRSWVSGGVSMVGVRLFRRSPRD